MAPLRVAGTDPGTSSLDVIVLEDGVVVDQARFLPDQLQADSSLPVHWLEDRRPLDLVAGPSGYGLPLVLGADCTERHIDLMTLVRPDERGQARGVAGFSSLVRAFCRSSLPVCLLPGVIHLPTVPHHRKVNRIDLGTADKLCVAALAQAQRADRRGVFYLVELGSVFTACLVVKDGVVVDGAGGTSGPFGWGSMGSWDGELAYLLSPLRKSDLFQGGVDSELDDVGERCFRESLLKAVAGLHAVHGPGDVLLSGKLIETVPKILNLLKGDLSRYGQVDQLASLPGAWVKHAAQGSALIADGLAGGTHLRVVDSLAIRHASGTVLDYLVHPRVHDIWGAFGWS
jgi:predicted butyrate kinase (DUF1464 family)